MRVSVSQCVELQVGEGLSLKGDGYIFRKLIDRFFKVIADKIMRIWTNIVDASQDADQALHEGEVTLEIGDKSHTLKAPGSDHHLRNRV